MRIGANYIPSKNWLYFWQDFDEKRVMSDLETIKSLGCDHIRAHLLWNMFQPNGNYMSEHCLNNLKKFVTLCEDAGIDFFLSLFTGWMSGFTFLPSWVRHGIKNVRELTRNEDYINAEKFYIKNIAAVVSHSRAFLGFDLGNELTCFLADCPEYCDEWARIMFGECEKYAPGKLHNNGVDHQPWFDDKGFSRESLVNDGAVTALHCWTKFTGAMDRNGILGTDSINIAPYMAALAQSYAGKDRTRMMWVQEFGIARTWENTLDGRIEFMDKTFEAMTHIENLWGVTWWCSHDIARSMHGFGELEYDLGLIDSDNNVKPEGKRFAELASKYRNMPAVDNSDAPKIKVCFDGGKINVDANMRAYMDKVNQGVYPEFVL